MSLFCSSVITALNVHKVTPIVNAENKMYVYLYTRLKSCTSFSTEGIARYEGMKIKQMTLK